jgi:hypothetical protein
VCVHISIVPSAFGLCCLAETCLNPHIYQSCTNHFEHLHLSEPNAHTNPDLHTDLSRDVESVELDVCLVDGTVYSVQSTSTDPTDIVLEAVSRL